MSRLRLSEIQDDLSLRHLFIVLYNNVFVIQYFDAELFIFCKNFNFLTQISSNIPILFLFQVKWLRVMQIFEKAKTKDRSMPIFIVIFFNNLLQYRNTDVF